MVTLRPRKKEQLQERETFPFRLGVVVAALNNGSLLWLAAHKNLSGELELTHTLSSCLSCSLCLCACACLSVCASAATAEVEVEVGAGAEAIIKYLLLARSRPQTNVKSKLAPLALLSPTRLAARLRMSLSRPSCSSCYERATAAASAGLIGNCRPAEAAAAAAEGISQPRQQIENGRDSS